MSKFGTKFITDNNCTDLLYMSTFEGKKIADINNNPTLLFMSKFWTKLTTDIKCTDMSKIADINNNPTLLPPEEIR